MKCLVVLSHLMSQDCVLGDESVARAKLAIDSFNAENYAHLITIGWAYRLDCDTPISDVFRQYIVKNSDIDPSSVVSLPYSRDTVGDAFFSLKFSQLNGVKELLIVTSDYHVNRTQRIFDTFFSDRLRVSVIGAKTALANEVSVQEHEMRSIAAFDKTFSQTNCDDVACLCETLSTLHPFYNGEVYPKIECK